MMCTVESPTLHKLQTTRQPLGGRHQGMPAGVRPPGAPVPVQIAPCTSACPTYSVRNANKYTQVE